MSGDLFRLAILGTLAGTFLYLVYRKKPSTPTGASTGACGRCDIGPIQNTAMVGRSPYSLHHANSSRFKAIGELLLLEDHMINDPCPDCMNKHSITASRFLSEAASLEGGEQGDLIASDVIESIRQNLVPEVSLELASQARDVRKGIQKKLNLSHKDGKKD